MDASTILPLLVVFGLDQTLWPFYIYTEECEFTPPFSKAVGTGEVIDFCSRPVDYYYEVPKIFRKLKDVQSKIAVVAYKGDFNISRELLQAFGWDKLMSYIELYPGNITTHFENIKAKSKLPFEEMLYFDDPLRNTLDTARSLGVFSVPVPVFEGMTIRFFEESVKQFHEERKRTAN